MDALQCLIAGSVTSQDVALEKAKKKERRRQAEEKMNAESNAKLPPGSRSTVSKKQHYNPTIANLEAKKSTPEHSVSISSSSSSSTNKKKNNDNKTRPKSKKKKKKPQLSGPHALLANEQAKVIAEKKKKKKEKNSVGFFKKLFNGLRSKDDSEIDTARSKRDWDKATKSRLSEYINKPLDKNTNKKSNKKSHHIHHSGKGKKAWDDSAISTIGAYINQSDNNNNNKQNKKNKKKPASAAATNNAPVKSKKDWEKDAVSSLSQYINDNNNNNNNKPKKEKKKPKREVDQEALKRIREYNKKNKVSNDDITLEQNKYEKKEFEEAPRSLPVRPKSKIKSKSPVKANKSPTNNKKKRKPTKKVSLEAKTFHNNNNNKSVTKSPLHKAFAATFIHEPTEREKRKEKAKSSGYVPKAARKETPTEKRARERLRTKAAREILSSEYRYVSHLQYLLEKYVNPLKDTVSTKDHSILFYQLETIHGFNTKLLMDVSKRMENWRPDKTVIGKSFQEFAPYFKMYTAYVNNYAGAIQMLTDLNDKSSSFRKFCERISQETASSNAEAETLVKQSDDELDAANANLDLNSLLIMPIQRIPRYRLLLKELVKLTPKRHPDNKYLTSALKMVQTAAHSINEKVREYEKRGTIVDICSQFNGDPGFMEPSRYFIKHGPLSKIGTKSHQHYEFFLFNDLLAYASGSANKYELHRKIDINKHFQIDDAHAADLQDEKDLMKSADKMRNMVSRAFKITSPQKSFIVYAATDAMKNIWMEDIQRCIDEVASRIDQGEEFGTAAPIFQKMQAANSCKVCTLSFSLLKRKRHCSKCGHLVCDSCSARKIFIPGREKVLQKVCDACFEQLKLEVQEANEAKQDNSIHE